MEPTSLQREKPKGKKPRGVQRRDQIHAMLQVTDDDFLKVQDDLRDPGVQTMLGRIKDLLESSRYSGRMLAQLKRNRCTQIYQAYEKRYVEKPESTVELGPDRRKLRAEEKQSKKAKQPREKPQPPSGTRPTDEDRREPAKPAENPDPDENAGGDAPGRRIDQGAGVFVHPKYGPITAGSWPDLPSKSKRDILEGFRKAYKAGLQQAAPIDRFLKDAAIVNQAFQTFEHWPHLYRRIITHVKSIPVGEEMYCQWMESGEILVFHGPLADACREYMEAVDDRGFAFRFDRVSATKWKEGMARGLTTKARPRAKPHFKALFEEAGNAKCEFYK